MVEKKKRPTAKSAAKSAAKSTQPRSFSGVIRERTKAVKALAKGLRDLVYEELPSAEETFYGGPRPMAMYRTTADICWIQPQKESLLIGSYRLIAPKRS